MSRTSITDDAPSFDAYISEVADGFGLLAISAIVFFSMMLVVDVVGKQPASASSIQALTSRSPCMKSHMASLDHLITVKEVNDLQVLCKHEQDLAAQRSAVGITPIGRP